MSFYSNSGTVQQLAITGQIVAFIGTSDPNGWLICDGRLLTTLVGTQYDNLKTLLSGTNLPDLRGKNLYGSSTIKTTGGVNSRSIAYNDLPDHTHSAGASGGGSHTHNYRDDYYQDDRAGSGPSNADDDGGKNVSHLKTTGVSSYNNHTVGTAALYGSETVTAINITNPYYTVNWIIKY